MSYVISFQAYSYTTFIVLTWGGTLMTIRHNIRRIGKVKFWALALLPLIYFLSNVVTVYQEIYPHSTQPTISENFAIPILLGSASVIACGILFGLSFLLIGRATSSTSHIRELYVTDRIWFHAVFQYNFGHRSSSSLSAIWTT